MSKRGGSADKRLSSYANKKRRLRFYTNDPTCQHCGRLTQHPKGYVIDHIQALCNGGTDTDDNLQLLCHDCHDKKTAKDLGYEYRERVTIGLDGWPVE